MRSVQQRSLMRGGGGWRGRARSNCICCFCYTTELYVGVVVLLPLLCCIAVDPRVRLVCVPLVCVDLAAAAREVELVASRYRLAAR